MTIRCDDVDFEKKKNKSMKLIFILVGTLTSKIVVFGAQEIQTWSYRTQRIHY